MNLPQKVSYIISALESAGFSAYAVGGAVRDSIMGVPANDWDITTNALPQEVKAVFPALPVIETGIKHGTVSVILDDEQFEVTTFRTESGYSDHRHPDFVSFSNNIEDDLSRRDFTMNAIAYSPSGFVDVFGGRMDIEARIIRCVGDPETRFNEDALRILRAMRFSSVLGFEIEEKTKKAMLRCKGLLKDISAERIFVELKKLLCGKNAFVVLEDCKDIIFEIIPELSACDGFDQKTPHHVYDVYGHIIRCVEAVERDAVLRLTMLLHDVAKPDCFFIGNDQMGHFYGHHKLSAEAARIILRRLKCDNETLDDVVFLIENHMTELRPEKKLVKRRLSNMGERRLRMLVKVQMADTVGCGTGENMDKLFEYEKLIDEVVAEGLCFSLKSLAVNGTDIINEGIAEGVQIGKVLGHLLECVIEERIENEKSVLIEEARRFATTFS